MHTRPVVVLALSAATGAGLILARNHQRRSRNGTAVAGPPLAPPVESSAARKFGEPTAVGDLRQPELFRIEARTVDVPRTNGSSAAPASVDLPAALPPVELPPERVSSATLVAVAAVLALCAVGLGAWAYGSRDHSPESAATGSVAADAAAISVLSSASARRIPLAGSAGRITLVVDADGRGVLVLDGLERAPSDKAYEAWVLRNGAGAAQRAGLFTGRERVVALTRPVSSGATVAVTLERAGGSDVPSSTPELRARRA